MASGWLYVLMFFAGVGIPLMAALNTSLGQHLGNPIAAVMILTTVAFVGASSLFALNPHATWAGLKVAPFIVFGAGLLFVLYIGSITFAAPQIGLGNAIIVVLVGQLISAALIDHFGLGGAAQVPIDLKRLAGFALLSGGVYLSIAR